MLPGETAMDAAEAEEARQTLAQLEDRLRRNVNDMVKVLVADAPVFAKRAVRRVFERSAVSDGLDDAALKALKDGTDAMASAVAAQLGERLSPFEAWAWTGADVPASRDSLDAHPTVSEALAAVGQAIGALLDEHGYTEAERGPIAYQLPAYFVAGQFMQSLVADYWRVLADHHELDKRLREEALSTERTSRRSRWDSV